MILDLKKKRKHLCNTGSHHLPEPHTLRTNFHLVTLAGRALISQFI